ncbi:Cell wall-associated hydrolase, NlpC family [Rhodococcus tukisamuensis]|uniref:Cell wall-associated hydrolase, NlpC family n=2 Tax=Rhodococcus tukisamuensis TaxID=168276 RepID=A0A1G7BME0_9NOCA|nr:Cell wall-associated hydrolase, NlpC family [Rhodococcus tukisamuensis]
MRRVVIASALALGAVTVSAAPAFAEPVTVPGVGTFDIPGVPAQTVQIPGLPAMPVLPGIPAPAAPAPVVTAGQKAVDAAASKIGSPYVWGASGPDAFDCSGLVQWAFKQAGIALPRTSYDQAAAGIAVPTSALQVGDVVSFYGGSHSGIYAGNGEVIHAATSGTPVKRAPIASMPMDGARRY